MRRLLTPLLVLAVSVGLTGGAGGGTARHKRGRLGVAAHAAAVGGALGQPRRGVATLPITLLSNDENAGPAAGGEANVVHTIAPVPTRVPV